MKRQLFLMLVTTALIMASCSKKDQTDPASSTTTASLPTKAASYVATNYPDASIDYILVLTNSTAKYVVTLNTTEELAFTSIGDYLGDGRQFHDGGHHGDTIFGDSTGCGGGHHGGGHHGGGHHGGGHGIPVDSLSTAITGYITANFAGYTIMHAGYDSLCVEGLVTEVMIGKRDSVPPLKLVFNGAGTFLFQASRVMYADVTQAVKNYITANYAGYEVCNRAEKLTLADNSLQYIIYLRQDRLHVSVRITADGTLICTR